MLFYAILHIKVIIFYYSTTLYTIIIPDAVLYSRTNLEG